ncbi:MAG: VOC family protein [Deinococcota bacterium]
MIRRQSHTTIFVLDQNEAMRFYCDVLEFEVRANFEMGHGLRWVTVSPKGQPDLELILAPIVPGPMFTDATVVQMKDLVEQGAFGIGVFETDDCKAEYERLLELDVTFTQPPQEQFYGLEALAKDNSGNWFSLVERKM